MVTQSPSQTTTSRQPTLTVLADTPATIVAEITLDDWLAFVNHPLQRDTQRHARAAHWEFAKHATGAALNNLHSVHGGLLDGTYYKVDGHTRAFKWSLGELPPPEKLTVTVYRCKNRADLDALYKVFDAQSAAETNYDKIYGAMQSQGLELTSRRLKHGFLTSALNIALRGVGRKKQNKKKVLELDLYKAVGVFRDELQQLDKLDPPSEVFYSGVIAAALIALALYPETIDFFARLAKRDGYKQAGRMDPVEAVLSLVQQLKNEKASWVNAQQEDLCARTYRAVMAWRDYHHEGGKVGEGPWFERRLRALDIKPVIEMLKEQKKITDEPRL